MIIKPRVPWLWLFVTVNIVGALMMLDSGELIGDLAGVKLHSRIVLFWATLLVIVTYLIILGPVFTFISKIKVKRINFRASESDLGRRIGRLLIASQLIYILFNLSTGINIAGSGNNKTNSLFSIFWVFFPVDALFLIYYGTYRDNRYFYPNLIIFLISNILRGWGGVFLIVIFLEWCRAIYNKKITIGKVTIAAIMLLVFYPLLQNIKWIIRASAGAEFSFEALVDGLTDNFRSADYFVFMMDGIFHLVGRLQTVSMVVEVIKMSDLLQTKFAAGEFAPFWKEGLHGIIFDRLFAGDKQDLIGVAFTKYANFGFEYDVGNWNVSLGYPSWFFITPLLTPLYIVYTLTLAAISFYFAKKIGLSTLSKDMLWYSWLGYLMAPWLLTFTGFIYALLIFLVLKIVFSSMVSVRGH